MIQKLGSVLFIILLPAASAYIYTEEVDGSLQVPVGGNMFLTAKLENATKINQEGVSDANFTTGNHTFPYHAAYRITYKNSKGQTDYLISGKCDNSPYLDDCIFDDITVSVQDIYQTTKLQSPWRRTAITFTG